MTCLVSTDISDPAPSRHCSEQGHTEGATYVDWKAFLSPGPHISEVTVLTDGDGPTKCSTTRCRHFSFLSCVGARVAFL